MNSEIIKNAINTLFKWLKDNHYKQNTIEFYRSRCKSIILHLEQTESDFNLEELLDWANKHTENKSLSIRCCLRRVIVMLDRILKGRHISYGIISFASPLKASKEDYVSAVDMFEKHLIRRGLEENTVKFSVYCANHYFCEMERQGIYQVSEISQKHVCDYLSLEQGILENSTKRAMSYRLRQLFRFLYDEKLKSEDLSVYVSTDYVIKKKMVTVLSSDMQNSLSKLDGSFTSVRLARDYAICMLALRLMLRKSDIFRLRLSDVDWKNKKVSILQKKNKQPLVLPLTDDAGNALATYILNYRPNSAHDEIFLSASLPYKPLSSANECLYWVLTQSGHTNSPTGYGLHLLRRTGASNLLRAGTSIDMISAMLGQQNASSVEPYLSVNEKGMLQCCGDFGILGFMEVMKWF